MTTIEQRKERIKMWIENIEQLGADLRYVNDYEDYNKFKPILDGIKHWSNMIQNHVDKIKEVEKNEKEQEG